MKKIRRAVFIQDHDHRRAHKIFEDFAKAANQLQKMQKSFNKQIAHGDHVCQVEMNIKDAIVNGNNEFSSDTVAKRPTVTILKRKISRFTI